MRTLATALGALLLVGCSDAVKLESPDGRYTATASRSSSGHIRVTIADAGTHPIFTKEVRALAWQGYSLRWSGGSFILDTTDIGPTRFFLSDRESWRSMNALHTVSPDRRLVVYTFWHDYDNRLVAVCILDGSLDPWNATTVREQWNTGLKVAELVDSVTWDSPRRFRVVGDHQLLVFERGADEGWSYRQESNGPDQPTQPQGGTAPSELRNE